MAVDYDIASNMAPGTSPVKRIQGGLYSMIAMGTWGGGNAQLQILGPDAATWILVTPAVTVNGLTYLQIPGGIYRVVSTTVTGLFVRLSKVYVVAS